MPDVSNSPRTVALRPAADQRASGRQRAAVAALTRLAVAGTGEGVYAWVHDLSADGIAFDLLGPVVPGQDVTFPLARGLDEAVELRARVVHAETVGGFWRIGCRFPAPLAPDLLADLLRLLRGAQP